MVAVRAVGRDFLPARTYRCTRGGTWDVSSYASSLPGTDTAGPTGSASCGPRRGLAFDGPAEDTAAIWGDGLQPSAQWFLGFGDGELRQRLTSGVDGAGL